MKNNWEIKTLGEMCDIKPPKSEARSQLKSTDLVSFVPMEDLGILSKTFSTPKERKLQDVSGSYTYFAEDDVLLAKITPCFENGKLGVAKNLKNGVGFGSSEFIVFRTKQDILPDYLFYVLSSDNFREEGKKVMSGAVGHKRVPKEYVENYKILIPPISEQRRIVKILDEKFGAIEELKKVTEQQIRDVKELFESRLNEVFNELIIKIGTVPFNNVCRLKSGNTISKRLEKESGDLLYIKVGDMNLNENEVKITTSSRFTSKECIPQSHRIPQGAVIFPKRGGAILTDKKRITEFEIVADLNIMAAIPSEDVSTSYLFYWFKTFKLKEISNGASILQINNYSFDNLVVPKPPLNIQNKVVKELDDLSEKTKELGAIFRRKIADLEELKKSYLEQAFSGNL